MAVARGHEVGETPDGGHHYRMNDHADRMDRARLALDGLSVGDAFGERFFGLGHGNGRVAEWLTHRTIDHPGPWRWTDDTAMALSVVEVLDAHASIDQADLAQHFCTRWRAEPWRGYGRGAHESLEAIRDGVAWEAASADLFGGSGSFDRSASARLRSRNVDDRPCARRPHTTCAIVGGVVAQAVGRAGIPADWLARREPLSGLSLDDCPVAW